MEKLLAGLRAAGEGTRLRLLQLLSRGEFNVSELTQILNQSQPRVSRHLKLMTEAGLLDRFKEGSWVLFRLKQDGQGANIARHIVDLVPADDPLVRRDLNRADEILAARREIAESYFSANAENWDQIRSLHVSEEKVEDEILRLLDGRKFEHLLDLGTGTGAVLKLLAPLAKVATGIDSSREMLAIARSKFEDNGAGNVQIRQGDILALPFDQQVADLVSIHQVLHFLDNPVSVLVEAVRVLKDDGLVLVVDFSPHELEFLRLEHAHRRLGLGKEDMQHWCNKAGLSVIEHKELTPPDNHEADGLTVSLWLCRKKNGQK